MILATTRATPLTKSRIVVLWILQIAAAAAFLGAGGAKLTGAQPMVEMFDKIGAGQWFRYLTGICEVSGAIGLLIGLVAPWLSFYAAVLLAAVMVGAILSHLTVLGGSPGASIVLLLVTGTIAWLRRDSLVRSASAIALNR